MDVTSSSTAGSGATAAAAKSKAGGEASAEGAMTADFNTFLKLLTTQLKYQDPLQPMESTEFVAQLASFSAVEQQIGANTRLDSILSALTNGASEGFADWIGKEVRAPTSAAFTGAPVDVGVTPVAGADKAILVVKNDFGTEVARVSVDPAADGVTWDGTDSAGGIPASGNYGFALEGYAGDTLLSTTEGSIFAKVTEVRRTEAGNTELVFATGDTVLASEVLAVR